MRNTFWWALLAVTILLWVYIGASCVRAESWEIASQKILSGIDPIKADLVRQAIVHGSKEWEAHTVFYHPLEAGLNWKKWANTSSGTLVRSGVASCTTANKRKWMGAWIWFEGYGIAHVEDNFPESSNARMFDLAVWCDFGQSYDSWIQDYTKVAVARNRNIYCKAVVLKPPGGWGNKEWELPR